MSSVSPHQCYRSVVGSWKALSNQNSVTIEIARQSITGTCPSIARMIFDAVLATTANLSGFYCPKTERIHFLRTNTITSVTRQDHSGTLSSVEPALSDTPYMTGVFAHIPTPFQREYSGLASKPLH